MSRPWGRKEGAIYRPPAARQDGEDGRVREGARRPRGGTAGAGRHGKGAGEASEWTDTDHDTDRGTDSDTEVEVETEVDTEVEMAVGAEAALPGGGTPQRGAGIQPGAKPLGNAPCNTTRPSGAGPARGGGTVNGAAGWSGREPGPGRAGGRAPPGRRADRALFQGLRPWL